MMSDTNKIWEVSISFYTYAEDGDKAFDIVKAYLPPTHESISWGWNGSSRAIINERNNHVRP